jgi:hypothetical protein
MRLLALLVDERRRALAPTSTLLVVTALAGIVYGAWIVPVPCGSLSHCLLLTSFTTKLLIVSSWALSLLFETVLIVGVTDASRLQAALTWFSFPWFVLAVFSAAENGVDGPMLNGASHCGGTLCVLHNVSAIFFAVGETLVHFIRAPQANALAYATSLVVLVPLAVLWIIRTTGKQAHVQHSLITRAFGALELLALVCVRTLAADALQRREATAYRRAVGVDPDERYSSVKGMADASALDIEHA